MRFVALMPGGARWEDAARSAESCSLRAGKALAARMRAGTFAAWGRVFAALKASAVGRYGNDIRARYLMGVCSVGFPGRFHTKSPRFYVP